MNLDKLINLTKAKLTYNRESWNSVKKKGILGYVLSKGLFQMGVLGGFICVTFFYFNKLNFHFGSFQFEMYIKNYLIWWPIAIFIGIVLSVFAWYEHENQFNDENDANCPPD